MKTFFKIFASIFLLTAIGGGVYFLVHGFTSKTGPTTFWPDFRQETKPESTEVTFLAVGDIMLSRDVAARMISKGKDGSYPFANISALLASTDFNFGNLESPFSGTDEQDPDPNTFTFNAPTYALKGLLQNNFKVLNLANNHALNQGNEGLLFTKKLLKTNSITALGAGNNKNEAWTGEVYQDKTGKDEIKIGFAGATYGPTSELMAQTSELAKLKQTVELLKTKSDFVVITMHAGEEYTRFPNNEQTRFAKAAIDYGADMVIGAHPHWVQTFETYKDKYIFYSLGNFVFDQSWSQDTKEGLTLKISLTKTEEQTTLKQIELVPIVIENNSQPRVASQSEKQSILKKIDATNVILK